MENLPRTAEAVNQVRKVDGRGMTASSSIVYLQEHGAHFVLCAGKRPVWQRWQARRPPVPVVLAHPGNIGLVPASIEASALDVDEGNPAELLRHHPCWADLPTRRRGGHHLYYHDHQGRGNAKWAAYGCAGEVRSGRGFLVLWEGGADRLAAAVRSGPAGTKFPADLPLFEAAGIALPRHYAPDATLPEVERLRPASVPALETVLKGRRNISLFDATRWWAYVAWHTHTGDIADWHEAVAEHAHRNNAQFPEPLPEAEARKVAYHVSTWVASGGGPIDHSAPAQARRGKVSGLVRRGILASKRTGDVGKQRTGRRRVEVLRRDQAILADRAAGMTYREIAARHGVSLNMAWKVCNRPNVR